MRKELLPLLAACTITCQSQVNPPAVKAEVDEAFFRCKVQPILTRDCSALACHGDGRRYFVVFARNRLRLGIRGEAERNAMMLPDEREFNFESARAMIDPDSHESSLLLLKPLKSGYFHEGAEMFDMGNVFLSRDDPEFKVLEEWVNGAKADPTCVEPGSDQ